MDRNRHDLAFLAASEKKIRDKEELRETFEILRDNDAIKTIKKSLALIQRGKRGKLWREILH